MKKGLIITLAIVLVFGLAAVGMAETGSIVTDLPQLYDVTNMTGDAISGFQGIAYDSSGVSLPWSPVPMFLNNSQTVGVKSWGAMGDGGGFVSSYTNDNTSNINFDSYTYSTSLGSVNGSAGLDQLFWTHTGPGGTALDNSFYTCAVGQNGGVTSYHETRNGSGFSSTDPDAGTLVYAMGTSSSAWATHGGFESEAYSDTSPLDGLTSGPPPGFLTVTEFTQPITGHAESHAHVSFSGP